MLYTDGYIRYTFQFLEWDPFYIVVYGFYVYHFSSPKIFLKLQRRIYLKLGYITYISASANA